MIQPWERQECGSLGRTRLGLLVGVSPSEG